MHHNTWKKKYECGSLNLFSKNHYPGNNIYMCTYILSKKSSTCIMLNGWIVATFLQSKCDQKTIKKDVSTKIQIYQACSKNTCIVHKYPIGGIQNLRWQDEVDTLDI